MSLSHSNIGFLRKRAQLTKKGCLQSVVHRDQFVIFSHIKKKKKKDIFSCVITWFYVTFPSSFSAMFLSHLNLGFTPMQGRWLLCNISTMILFKQIKILGRQKMFAKSDATQEILKFATEDFHYKHGVWSVYY